MHLKKKKSFVKSNRTPRHCEVLRSNLILPLLALSILFSCTTKKAPLPFIGEIDFNEKGDTVYHTIPAFEMINQEGKTITNKDFEGKIYVADFFFTTCGSICPVMTNNLVKVQNEFISDNDIKILSFTVNPETDSVQILKAYANKYGANGSKWSFCTGTKNKIYILAQRGFLLVPPDVDVNDSSQFIHDERFNLVDAKGRIRGTYSGTDSLEVQQLIEDIKTLKDELHSAEQKN
jgi:protein SCO1/2